jgi:DnaD/phage-associated family protein
VTSKENIGLTIPPEVLHNKGLSDTEKIVLAEIKKLEPCTASNQHLADFLGMSRLKIIRTIKNLIEKNFVQVTRFSETKREYRTSIKIDTSIKNDTSENDPKNGIKNDTSASIKNDTPSIKIDTDASIKNDTGLVSKLIQTSIKNDTQVYRDNNEYIDKYIEEDNARAREDSPPSVPDEVLKAYQDEIRPVCSAFEMEKLAEDVKHFGSDCVVKAIQRAVLRNKRSLSYIEGILKRWETDGYDEGGTHGKSGRNSQQDEIDTWAEQFAHLGSNENS